MGILVRAWFSLLALPTILIIVVNITDKILTPQVMDALAIILWYVDQILWTKVVDLLLVCVSTILIIRIVRRFFRFITWNLKETD